MQLKVICGTSIYDYGTLGYVEEMVLAPSTQTYLAISTTNHRWARDDRETYSVASTYLAETPVWYHIIANNREL